MGRSKRYLGLVLLSLCPGLATATVAQWESLGDAELQALRGGFLGKNGLQIDFRLEQLISINGELQAHTVLHLPAVSGRPGNGAAPRASLASSTSVQHGGANGTTQIYASPLQTLIQNDRDGQQLQHFKVVNIDFNRIRGLGQINFHSRVQQGVVESLR